MPALRTGPWPDRHSFPFSSKRRTAADHRPLVPTPSKHGERPPCPSAPETSRISFALSTPLGRHHSAHLPIWPVASAVIDPISAAVKQAQALFADCQLDHVALAGRSRRRLPDALSRGPTLAKEFGLGSRARSTSAPVASPV